MLKAIYRNIRKLMLVIGNDHLSDGMKTFIKLNKRYWIKEDKAENNEYCLIDGSHTTPTYLLQSSRIAKAIEEESGKTPIVLLKNMFSSINAYYFLYKSFNINNFISYKQYLFNPFVYLKAFVLTWHVYLSAISKDMDKFVEFKYNGIRIGDLIYDSILRKYNNVFTLNTLELKYFNEVKNAFLMVIIYDKLLSRIPVKQVIVPDVVYHSGILPRIALKKNIEVIISIRFKINTYKNEMSRYQVDKDMILEFGKIPNLINKSEIYLNERFDGKIDNYDAENAYKDKKTYDREMLAEKLNISNNNPCVFIMCHALSDAPHISGLFLYRDYYQWLLETLKIITEVKGVNWIVKSHPSSKMYNEVGVVEDLINKNYSENKNVFICPSDLSTKSIKDVSLAIVTVQGTVAMEYGCLGIPTIICASPHYHGFGFTIKAESVDEYKSLLKNISDLKPLNDEQIKMAKIYYYWHAKYSDIKDKIMPSEIILPNDDFVEKREKIFKEMNDNLKENDPKDNFYNVTKKFLKNKTIL